MQTTLFPITVRFHKRPPAIGQGNPKNQLSLSYRGKCRWTISVNKHAGTLKPNKSNKIIVEFIRTKIVSKVRKREIFNLWNKEYPEKLSYGSLPEFENYLEKLTNPSYILLLDENQNIKGCYFDFIRDKEKWFVMILDSIIHGQGFGTQILNLAKEWEFELNGWVIDHNNDKKQNGAFYNSPLDFYLKNGFEIHSDIRLELDQLSAVKIKWGINRPQNKV